MNSRKEWIDGLRALAMLIVMTWHISNGINSQWLFSLITAPIMIPLFFSITGYVFNDCEGNQKLFYTKLFKYLVFPWLCLAFLKGSINALINRSFVYFLEYSSNLFTGSNLWYFPCCIIAEILFFYNLKLSKKSLKLISIYSIILLMIGFILKDYSFFDNLNISTAFICQLFLLIGLLIKNVDIKNVDIKKTSSVCTLFYISIMLTTILNILPLPISCYGIIPMDVHKNFFFSIPMCFSLIITGNLAIFHVFKHIIHFPSIISFIGQNTIVFYVFHYDTLRPFDIILSKLGFITPETWILVIIKLIYSILVCSCIALVFNKFLPQLVGKRNK